MKGCYCLIIEVKENKKIKIGKLGKIEFKTGFYVYVGSAMNSLESHLKRHLRKNKKLHWHIDYLLNHSKIDMIIYNISNKKIECEISQNMKNISGNIDKFGCSDCDCTSHLYYFKKKSNAIESIINAYNMQKVKNSILNKFTSFYYTNQGKNKRM